MNSTVDFTNRRRLTIDPTTGRSPALVGSAGTGSEAVGFKVTHNFTDRFKIMSQAMIYNGFIWNFEDTDFRIFSSENGLVHSWAAVDLKPTPLFRVMFKVSHSTEGASSRVVDGQTPQGNWIRNPQVTDENLDYRIQLSYAL